MISELRTLIAVARHGTFAAAGKRLGLTQAGVSGHIRRLEKTLGFPLFERTGRSARLNASGVRTLEQAEGLVAAFDALSEPAKERAANTVVRFGAIASVQATIVARALVPFRSRYPTCRIHLTPGVSLHLIDKVDAGELDLAIVIRPAFDLPSNLAWMPLVTEDYALLAPADAEGVNWQTLVATRPFIRYDRSSFGGRQVDRFLRREGVSLCEWLELDDLQAMVTLVQGGVGCAIVPITESILPLLGGVQHMAVGPNAPRRHIGIVRPQPDSTEMIAELTASLVAARS